MNGVTLSLTYNEILDDFVSLPVSAFTVTVDGGVRAATSTSVSGRVVTLVLATGVEAGQTVTVAYTRPDSYHFIRDTLGNLGESFSARAVINNTAAPVPEITSTSTYTVAEGDTAVATLSATDEDTPAGQLAWSVTGGPDASHLTLSSAGRLAFSSSKDFENPDDSDTDGAYMVTVQVSDGTGTDSADLSITLSNVNERPTADAGADLDVEQGAVVTLGGTGTDPDAGDILGYTWTRNSGPAVTLSTTTAATVTLTAPSGLSATTTLGFTLRVTDTAGLHHEDTVVVTVRGPSEPSTTTTDDPASPEITSTSSYTVAEGETSVATLSATDEDTPAGQLAWSITGGPDDSHLTLSSAGRLAFSSSKDFESPDDSDTDGTYMVTVQVSDGGRTDSADLSITLTNVNEPPKADAGADLDVEQGVIVTLGGTGTDPDAGDTLGYRWTRNSGPAVTLSTTTAATVTLTAPSGLSATTTLGFTLRVTDTAGLHHEDAVVVTVRGPSEPSTTTTDDPASPEITSTSSYTVAEGETSVATLSATDEDTPAGQLAWSITGGPDDSHLTLSSAGRLAFSSSKDFESPDDSDSDGAYRVTVQVSDGERKDSADLSITLSNVNEPPKADAGDDLAVEQGIIVTLGGTGTDPDAGDTLGYTWTRNSGPAVTLSTTTAASVTFTAPTGLSGDATLSFTLRVADAAGLYHEDRVEVTVQGPSAPPAATISADAATVPEGSAAVFTLRLDRAATGTLSVDVTISESGATLADSAATTSALFAAGDDISTLSLSTTGDDTVEDDSTVAVTLSAGDGYTLGATISAEVRVADDDTPTWRVSAQPREIDEGATTTLTVAITNGKVFADDRSISLSVSGTASASDHTLSQHQLTLESGANSVATTLAAIDDDLTEDAETVVVSASHGGTQVGSTTVTILAGDEVQPSDDATLASLTLSGIDLESFDSATITYVVGVGYDVQSTAVTVTTSDDGAGVVIADADGSSDGNTRTVALSEGANDITVTVTAEDDVTTLVYSITVNRAGAAETWGARLPDRDIVLGPDSQPSGLWSDGEDMWVVTDWTSGEVGVYSVEDGEEQPGLGYTLSGDDDGFPAALWSHDGTLWVADFNNGGVLAYRLSDGERLSEHDLDADVMSAAGNIGPSGLWSDGETMWVTDYYESSAFAYRLSDKAHVPELDIQTTGNGGIDIAPFGLWSDGETVLVSSWYYGRAYAYDLSDGTPLPDLDIDMSDSGTNNPYDLWTDGEILWIVDELAGVLYAYAVPGLE